MAETTLSTDEVFLVLHCLIDELYKELAPDWVRFRQGTERMKMTDSEIITLSVMQEGRSNDSEVSFHRLIEKDYRALFPELISRSRYHRRRKTLMGIQREMLRVLMRRMCLSVAWLMVDSAPVVTAKSPRWKSARMSIWAAQAEFCAAKTTRARSLWGVMTCMAAKLLAYMLGYAINRGLGRRATALKSLYL